MDRRAFLALGVLAAAADMPAFAEQVRLAGEKGDMTPVKPATIVTAIYKAALSRNGPVVGTRALTKLGYNRTEASAMTTLTISIARKARSLTNFLQLARPSPPRGVDLNDSEMALLRMVAGRAAALRGGPWGGRTWEGGGGDTWVNKRLVVAPSTGNDAPIWDGRTWEGSEL